MYPFKVKPLVKIVGLLLMIEALFMLTALPFSFYYERTDAMPIIYSAAITAAVGLILWFSRRNYEEREIGMREGYLIVLTVWIIISVFGALPYYISGAIPHYTDAFFETMSGFSTTGASILRDIEIIPKGLLFWRAMTHWLGGMGIIVLTIAILPFLGFGGMSLFFAEVPGIEKEKLSPRIKNTARSLWGIYAGLTFAMVIMLMLGGMNFFESICHAFAALATGGFSPKNTSLAGYSPYIQYVSILFMFLAGTNFTLHYLAINGKIKKAISGVEYRTYVLIILISSILITIGLIAQRHYGIEEAWRSALFNVVSIISCTGFANEDYMLWPVYAWFILFMLMFIGGMAGSTSGSIKVIRWVVLLKNLRVSLRHLVHPSGVFRVRVDGRALNSMNMHNVLAIFYLYLLTFFIGTLILTITGLDLISSMGSVATCMGGIGPGLNTTGPVANYAHLTDVAKWTLSFLMLLGRLELFSVFVTWSRAFWKN
ncbi:MAG TPA: TrkH family potassium uptake protein [Lentimicrobium sp.]|nr:TrkH family potassium uptake protein [Lentimicrobium sp.]